MSYREWIEILRSVLTSAFGSEEFVRVYLELSKPCLSFRYSSPENESAGIRPGSTKLGGSVDLPKGCTPPLVKGRDTWLIAQINIAELPDRERWFGSESGMVYLYARGNAGVESRKNFTGENFELFADIWQPWRSNSAMDADVPVGFESYSFAEASQLDENGNASRGQVLADLPEVAMTAELALAVPNYNLLNLLANFGPTSVAGPINRLLDVPSPYSSCDGFDFFVWPLLEDCVRLGVPILSPDAPFSMFGIPENLSDLDINQNDWYCERWALLVGLDEFNPFSEFLGESQSSVARWIDRAELCVKVDEDGRLDCSRQVQRIRWEW